MVAVTLKEIIEYQSRYMREIVTQLITQFSVENKKTKVLAILDQSVGQSRNCLANDYDQWYLFCIFYKYIMNNNYNYYYYC